MRYFNFLNPLGAVQVKIVVKLRGQNIAYRDYARAQTKMITPESHNAVAYHTYKHHYSMSSHLGDLIQKHFFKIS